MEVIMFLSELGCKGPSTLSQAGFLPPALLSGTSDAVSDLHLIKGRAAR